MRGIEPVVSSFRDDAQPASATAISATAIPGRSFDLRETMRAEDAMALPSIAILRHFAKFFGATFDPAIIC